MEPEKQADPLAIIPALSKFHSEGKYSDVKLQIGDEVFECQRILLSAISEYFEAMFFGSFKEKCSKSNDPIVLFEINVVAFKEILHLLYTGDIRVNDSNVIALLRSSDFLQLRTVYVEDQCFKYLQNNSETSKPMSQAWRYFRSPVQQKRIASSTSWVVIFSKTCSIF